MKRNRGPNSIASKVKENKLVITSQPESGQFRCRILELNWLDPARAELNWNCRHWNGIGITIIGIGVGMLWSFIL